MTDEEEAAEVFNQLVECPKCGFVSWSKASPEANRFHLRERGWRRVIAVLLIMLCSVAGVIACQNEREWDADEADRFQRMLERK